MRILNYLLFFPETQQDMLRRICCSSGKCIEFAYLKEKPCILSSSMQKHLKGSCRATAHVNLFGNTLMRVTLNVNLCPKEDASPFHPFWWALVKILTIFASSWCALGLRKPLLVLRKWIAFPERCQAGWKNESYCNTQRDVGLAVRDEIKASWVWKSQVVLKMYLLERPSGGSQVFHLFCQDIAVNRQCDSNSNLHAVSDFGVQGSLCNSRCNSAVVVWGLLLHHCLPGAQEGARVPFLCGQGKQCLSATSAELFCGCSHHHPYIILRPVKTVNFTSV